MLIEESKWLAQRVLSLSSSGIFPILNLGSQSEYFIKKSQPWIYENLIKKIRDMGEIINLDMNRGPGVDIVEDLNDTSFLKKLSNMEFNTVFCFNLLEHVHNRTELCKAITEIIPDEGYILVSCPREYPWHPDPIDTMFRPNMDDLAELFPQTKVIDGEIVKCGTFFHYATRTWFIALKNIIRIFTPFYRPKRWLDFMRNMAWLFKRYSATCLVLKRNMG